MATKQYEALKTAAGPSGAHNFQAGSTIDLTDEQAKPLLADGAVRLLSDKDATKAVNRQPDEPNEEPAIKKPSGKKAKSPAK